MLFNVYINDLDNRMECTFSRFADTTLWGAADKPKGRTAIGRDLSRLEKWDERKKSCRWNGKTPSPQAEFDWLQRRFTISYSVVLEDTKENMDQQCAFVVKKANGKIFCINKGIVRWLRGAIILLFSTWDLIQSINKSGWLVNRFSPLVVSWLEWFFERFVMGIVPHVYLFCAAYALCLLWRS